MPQSGPSHIEAIELFAQVLGQIDHEAPTSAFYGNLCRSTCELASLDRAVMFLYDSDLRRVRAVGSYKVDTTEFRDVYVHANTIPIARRALFEDRVVQVEGNTLVNEMPEAFRHLLHDRWTLCVPVSVPGSWVGAMIIDREIGASPVDDENLELLWTLGKAIALAATARAATREAEWARQLQQRIDLAREIHDGVIQRLFGVSLALSASEGPLAEEERGRCASEVQEALADLRTALQRPLGATLPAAQSGFGAELERLAAAHADIHLRQEEGTAADVPAEFESLSQHVLAETVRNARKHAMPTGVSVRTRQHDGAFFLEIENDGVAEQRAPGPPGVGLRLTAFEALQHGGVLEFGPRGDDRWQVRLVVPLTNG
ncbi:MAG: hypothetical protein JHC95_23020 [Solirubrobacteraceae bacterium]|nr:hypothetical protein [Solirubrobacteraceae bacterium]